MSSSTINDVIMHPNAHNTSNGNGNLELWNKGNIAITINNNNVYKTIYDPSPCKYKEPISGAYTGFTIANTVGGWNNGWNYYCQSNSLGGTIYFSALGLRYANSGIVDRINNSGYYWTAGPSGNSYYARYLDFFSNQMEYYENERAYGFTSRSIFDQ